MSEPEYAVAWTASARRALNRLPEKAATAAVEFIYGSLAADPRRVGKPLKLGLEGLHSSRRGDYRVIYRIRDHDRRIDIVAVGHRRDAYRPRGSYEPGEGSSARRRCRVRRPVRLMTGLLPA